MTQHDDGRFVSQLEIVRVIPCLADPSKIRFSSRFDRDVSEILPYVNATLEGAIYTHAGKSLTLRRQGSLITLYPRRLEASKVSNLDDAKRIVAWIVDMINDLDRRRLQIDPDFERHDHLTVLDVLKLLPGTNCKGCGLATCLAFAAALSDEKVTILTCTDLFLTQYHEKREELLKLLRAGGYPVPAEFSNEIIE
jgi:ArsR family metal-binding transcriptional regulator